MKVIRRVKSALLTLLHRQQVESELDQEIRSYVEALTEEKIAAGLTPAEARRQALIECGGPEQVKQAVRDQRAGTWIESVLQDIRYGLRQMVRNPSFALTTILTLGLSIGATTAIFSAVNALLIRPLPYSNPARLMEISQQWPKVASIRGPLLSPDFVAAQSSVKSFQSLSGFVDRGYSNLTGTGAPIRVRTAGITANLLPTLRIKPEQGRNFLDTEDQLHGPAVVLLSHRLWKSRFNGDPQIIGRSINLGGKSSTVIGVLPEHFFFPDAALEPDACIPAGLDSNATLLIETPVMPMRVIGRLRDGVTAQAAESELNVSAVNRARDYPALIKPWAAGRHMTVDPLQRYLAGDNRTSLLILLACVGAVLLIACVNVANLQLARTVTRLREMALRGALGAGRLRLVRQLLVESLTLASASAFLGLGIAIAVIGLIRRGAAVEQSASSSQILQQLQVPMGKLGAMVQVDGWVLGFAAGLALLTTILFGLAPAIGASRTDLRTTLQAGGQRVSSSRTQRRLRGALLTVEIGLAVVLLAGAGLLIRSFVNVLRNDSGFDPRQCLAVQIGRNYPEAPEKTRSFVHQLLSRIQALPGVEAAAVASALPLEGVNPNNAILPGDGPKPPRSEWPVGRAISVSPAYFRAAGTPVLRGRAFTVNDNEESARVAIVNQAFASQFLHEKTSEVLGQRVKTNINAKDATDFTTVTVVGEVADVRYTGIEGTIEPVIFFPIDQVQLLNLNLLLRTTVEPDSLATAVRKASISVDPQQPLFNMETMEARTSQMVGQRRFIMLLIAAFAALSLLLAGIGVCGVFTYWVNQRRQELGIRLALGSSRPGLFTLILMQATRLTLIGGGAGLLSAWFLTHLLSSMLVGVKTHDPATLTLSWMMMTAIVLIASGLPAINASRTDIVSVLHSE